MYRIFRDICSCDFEICERTETRHTDTLIAMIRIPTDNVTTSVYKWRSHAYSLHCVYLPTERLEVDGVRCVPCNCCTDSQCTVYLRPPRRFLSRTTVSRLSARCDADALWLLDLSAADRRLLPPGTVDQCITRGECGRPRPNVWLRSRKPCTGISDLASNLVFFNYGTRWRLFCNLLVKEQVLFLWTYRQFLPTNQELWSYFWGVGYSPRERL